MLLRQACSTLRTGLFRRAMATAGRRPDTPQKMVSLQEDQSCNVDYCISLFRLSKVPAQNLVYINWLAELQLLNFLSFLFHSHVL